jgi:hypothetical protein
MHIEQKLFPCYFSATTGKTKEFNKTLWEPSMPKGDAHIVALFSSDTLTQSYGP